MLLFSFDALVLAEKIFRFRSRSSSPRGKVQRTAKRKIFRWTNLRRGRDHQGVQSFRLFYLRRYRNRLDLRKSRGEKTHVRVRIRTTALHVKGREKMQRVVFCSFDQSNQRALNVRREKNIFLANRSFSFEKRIRAFSIVRETERCHRP